MCKTGWPAVCQTAHTNQMSATTFSRAIDLVGKGTQATIQPLLMVMSIFLPWERFVIRLKIHQTVLTFSSHKFTTPRTPVRTSRDKKGQSYFLIWSSLLYSTSGLGYRSGYIPRDKVPMNFTNSFLNTQQPPEKIVTVIHTFKERTSTWQKHRHRQKSHESSTSPAPSQDRFFSHQV